MHFETHSAMPSVCPCSTQVLYALQAVGPSCVRPTERHYGNGFGWANQYESGTGCKTIYGTATMSTGAGFFHHWLWLSSTLAPLIWWKWYTQKKSWGPRSLLKFNLSPSSPGSCWNLHAFRGSAWGVHLESFVLRFRRGSTQHGKMQDV